MTTLGYTLFGVGLLYQFFLGYQHYRAGLYREFLTQKGLA